MSEPNKAVFLSYASQDAATAKRICDALRASGIEVWFDQSELRGGDVWDRQIRKQIHDCALFVPIISANSQARLEGYFRREWRLAVDRTHDMADSRPFLVPVVIDDTKEQEAEVPESFRAVQWSRLPTGETPPPFVERVSRLLSPDEHVAPATVRLAAGAATSTISVSKEPTGNPGAPWRSRPALLLIAAAALIAVGYVAIDRFVLAKRAVAAEKTAPVAAVAAVSEKSIAVLPFQNLTGRIEDAYLADGLQEEILNALARMRDLKVISRTSASEFYGPTPNIREVGRRLSVGSVLEGSVRREGQKLRLTIQLIDARNDRHLLAADYDRDLGHILGLQSEVARKVAVALSATINRYEQGALDHVGTNNGDAYNLYLRAVALWRQPDANHNMSVLASKSSLEQAVRLDPDYSDAWALLSQAYTFSNFLGDHPADAASAKRAYERALQLDPQLPEALLARGLYEMYVARDLNQALVDLTAVVQLRPNSAEAQSIIGLVLRRRGRFDEALAHLERAWDLDPLNRAYNVGPLTTLIGLRRYPEAVEQTKLYQRRFPGDPEAYLVRARIEGFMQHSIEPLRQALRDHGDALQTPGDRKAVEAEIARAEGRYLDAVRLWAAVPVGSPLDRDARIGLLYWAAGSARDSERKFRDLEHGAKLRLQREPHASGVSAMLALAQSMLGEHEAAVAAIESEQARTSESSDAVNGPAVSFLRSVILVRAGRAAAGYAEATRLLHVPFSTANEVFYDPNPVLLLIKDDRNYDDLINRPPRL